MLVSVTAYSQGTVNFANRVTGILDAPIFDTDTVTKLAGTGYMAQLYAGATADSLAAVGDALPFRTGTGAGYINTSGIDPTRTINAVTPGATAFIKVVAWNVATPAIKGESTVFSLATGGGSIPPGPPANLVGLTSFSLIIPEPSTIALGLLGAAMLLLRRRQ